MSHGIGRTRIKLAAILTDHFGFNITPCQIKDPKGMIGLCSGNSIVRWSLHCKDGVSEKRYFSYVRMADIVKTGSVGVIGDEEIIEGKAAGRS